MWPSIAPVAGRFVFFELVELETAFGQAAAKCAEHAELGAEHGEQSAGRLLAAAGLREAGCDNGSFAIVDGSAVVAYLVVAHLAAYGRLVRKALLAAGAIVGKRLQHVLCSIPALGHRTVCVFFRLCVCGLHSLRIAKLPVSGRVGTGAHLVCPMAT